jgi:hypothetical protein
MPGKKTIAFPILFVSLLSIVLAILLLWNIGRGLFQSNDSETIQASIQRIELIIPASGFVARTEHLVLSPDEGKVLRLQEAGELLRPQTEIIQLKKGPRGTETILNEFNGLLSYIKDECEEKFVLANLDQLLLQEIIDPPAKQTRLADDQSVKKGDFLFRIVENDEMHLVLAVDPKYTEFTQSLFSDSFKPSSEINFRVESPTNLILGASVQKIEKREKDHSLVILSTPYYIDTLLNNRKISGFFTFGYVNASLLPKTALHKGENGKYYVYEKNDEPRQIEVTLRGLDPFTQQYIVEGLETSQEIYTDAGQWIKDTPPKP